MAHLRKRVDELAQNRYVGPRAERVTVKDLLALVTKDYATTGNRSSRTLKFRVAALESELGHLRAVAVSSGAIEAYKSKRLGDGKAKATDFRSAWRKAVEAIGQPGLLFHDLRRSAVTNMIRAGVPEQTAMRISVHRTSSVFRRYRIVETKDLLSALHQTQSSLNDDPDEPATFPHNGIEQ